MLPALLVTLACALPPAWGQDAGPPVACHELAALNATLIELVSTLRERNAQAARRQELELAIAYLQFRSRRIETLEQELRRTEDRRTSSEDFLGQVQEEVRAAEETLPDLPPDEADRVRAGMDQIQRRVFAEEAKLDRLERQIIDLQNEISAAQRQLATFEDFVLENLDLGD